MAVRFTVAEAEAHSDGLYAPPEDLWPDGCPCSPAGRKVRGGYAPARDVHAAGDAGRASVNVRELRCVRLVYDGPEKGQRDHMDGSTTLLKPGEAAELLRISRTTLAAMEQAGRLTPVDIARPGARKRLLRYRHRDLLKLIGLADD